MHRPVLWSLWMLFLSPLCVYTAAAEGKRKKSRGEVQLRDAEELVPKARLVGQHLTAPKTAEAELGAVTLRLRGKAGENRNALRPIFPVARTQNSGDDPSWVTTIDRISRSTDPDACFQGKMRTPLMKGKKSSRAKATGSGASSVCAPPSRAMTTGNGHGLCLEHLMRTWPVPAGHILRKKPVRA